jgi:Holliday junction resolvase-like predicted endonuclease
MRTYADPDISFTILVSLFVAAISVIMYFYTKPAIPAKEEELDGYLLEKKVMKQLNSMFHTNPVPNVVLQHTKGTAEIDIVQVTRKGIFVVECKYRTDEVSGSAIEHSWDVTRNGKKIATMYSPIKQNANHIKALESYLKKEEIEAPAVYNVVVVVAKELSIKELDQIDTNTVLVQGLSDLKKLDSLPDELSDKQVLEFQAIIERKESTEYQRRKHVEYVKKQYSKPN